MDLDIIYLDLKKAFDSVPHRRLLAKLDSYGIRGNVLLWLQDFLTNRTQKSQWAVVAQRGER